MKYLCVNAWDSQEQFADFVSKVDDPSYDRKIIFGQNEYHSAIVEKYNLDTSKIDVLTGASIYHVERDFKYTGWDTWFFVKAYCQLLSKYKNLNLQRTLINQKSFNIPFASFNSRAHDHRCYMIDQLAKYNLVELGLVSWNRRYYSSDHTYPFEYFDDRELVLDKSFYETGNWFEVVDDYHTTFCHLVNESTMDAIFITEKTALPILHFKPFLVVGPRDFYKRLDELGFEKYTEIFDYSFDSVADNNERIRLVVENINRIARLSESHLAELQKKLKPKLMHNFYTLEQIVYDFDNWHPLAKECIEQSKLLGQNLDTWINYCYNMLAEK